MKGALGAAEVLRESPAGHPEQPLYICTGARAGGHRFPSLRQQGVDVLANGQGFFWCASGTHAVHRILVRESGQHTLRGSGRKWSGRPWVWGAGQGPKTAPGINTLSSKPAHGQEQSEQPYSTRYNGPSPLGVTMSEHTISVAVVVDGPEGPEIRRPPPPLVVQAARLHRDRHRRRLWASEVLSAAALGRGGAQVEVAPEDVAAFAEWVGREGLRSVGQTPGRVTVFGWVRK